MIGAKMRSQRAARLEGETEESAEQAREERMTAEAEQGIAAAQLRAVRGYTKLGVALSHIKRRLEPIEPESDERAVNNAIAHVVELGPQQPEDQQHAECLCAFFGDWRGDRGCQQQRGIRPQDLGNKGCRLTHSR